MLWVSQITSDPPGRLLARSESAPHFRPLAYTHIQPVLTNTNHSLSFIHYIAYPNNIIFSHIKQYSLCGRTHSDLKESVLWLLFMPFFPLFFPFFSPPLKKKSSSNPKRTHIHPCTPAPSQCYVFLNKNLTLYSWKEKIQSTILKLPFAMIINIFHGVRTIIHTLTDQK